MSDARAKAAEVLRPFAEYADRYDETSGDSVELWQNGERCTLTVGSLRRAAEALADLSAEAAEVPADRIERAAKALFEKIWPKLDRLDGKNTWETTDEAVRQGIRDEVAIVLHASAVVSADREGLARGPECAPLPWSGREERFDITDTGDADLPFVIRDAAGKVVVTIEERYGPASGQSIEQHTEIGHFIVKAASALRQPAVEEEVEAMAMARRAEGLAANIGTGGEFARDALALLRRLSPPADGWRPIEGAPRDGKPYLWFGRWKPYDILAGGGPCQMIFRWSSLDSSGNPKSEKWYADSTLGATPETWNVEWTHWRPLPAPPPPEEAMA